jgi:hypothetical protein
LIFLEAVVVAMMFSPRIVGDKVFHVSHRTLA